MTPTLFILAGGASSRMGENKLLLRDGDGRLLVRRWFDGLHWPAAPRLVLPPGATPPAELVEWPTAHDAATGEGPLRGVAAALTTTSDSPWRLIVPVDMPGLGRTQLDWLTTRAAEVSDARLWMTRHDGEVEPFPMLIHTDFAPVVARRLSEGRRSLHGLATEASARVVDSPDWPEAVWCNLNRPADLAAYLGRSRAAPSSGRSTAQ